MANKKKINEEVNAKQEVEKEVLPSVDDLEVVEDDFDADEVVKEDKAVNTGLKVYRRKVRSKKTNKDMYIHFTKVIIRGREQEVSLVPPDRKGYELLDIVFGDDKCLDLYQTSDSMKGADGRYVNFTVYEVRAYDGNDMYSCKVKPQESTDKQMLLKALENV